VSVPDVWRQVLDFFGTPLVIERSPGQLSGDAGLLPVRQFDQRIGLTRAFAEGLDDPRDRDLTEHSLLDMVRMRRQRDPLGEGHPCTWRTLLIKVAAEVLVRTRRIVVRLSSSWPHLDWYRRVCERLGPPVPTPAPNPSG
jgi:hypothetical protein